MVEMIGDEFWARLQRDMPSEVRKWLDREAPDVLERVNRLIVVEDEYRLDCLSQLIPASHFAKLAHLPAMPSIHRGLPAGRRIRPGDWVAMDRGYALEHARRENSQPAVDSLSRVLRQDIYWAGTDMREFFYLPQAWRAQGVSVDEYLRGLTHHRAMALFHGEVWAIDRYAAELAAIEGEVRRHHAVALGLHFHGEDHWSRVDAHGLSVARSLGENPLLTKVFALVHDSHRLDDGDDLEHGPRAADFIAERRDDLFSFLDDGEVEQLEDACRYHSDGMVDGAPLVRACWDADRLDLGRVGIVPDPRLLCTEYARRPEVIAQALRFSGFVDAPEELLELDVDG